MKIGEVTRVATSISNSYERNDKNLTTSIQELSIINDFYVMMESQNGILLFSPEQETRLPIQIYLDQTSKLKNLLNTSDETDVSFRMNTGLEDYQTLA